MSDPKKTGQPFRPSGWDYADPVADQLEIEGKLTKLSESEVFALLAGKQVPNPAPMLVYDTCEDFVADLNNFWAQFGLPRDSYLSIVYRRRPVFQRFELLHPERVAALTMIREHKAMRDDPDVPGYSPDEYRMLYEAYQIMAALVSEDDAWVLKPDGNVDAYYLAM